MVTTRCCYPLLIVFLLLSAPIQAEVGAVPVQRPGAVSDSEQPISDELEGLLPRGEPRTFIPEGSPDDLRGLRQFFIEVRTEELQPPRVDADGTTIPAGSGCTMTVTRIAPTTLRA